jgi:hypothetical protein
MIDRPGTVTNMRESEGNDDVEKESVDQHVLREQARANMPRRTLAIGPGYASSSLLLFTGLAYSHFPIVPLPAGVGCVFLRHERLYVDVLSLRDLALNSHQSGSSISFGHSFPSSRKSRPRTARCVSTLYFS